MSDTPRSRRGGRPWYAAGLHFECLPDCGACCVNHGEATFVYIDDEETARLAALLEMSVEAFLARYTRLEDGDRVLADSGDACVFLAGRRCTVYAARPLQCRTFPFWPENLRSRRGWSALADFCPGIDRGTKHELVEIRDQLDLHPED